MKYTRNFDVFVFFLVFIFLIFIYIIIEIMLGRESHKVKDT